MKKAFPILRHFVSPSLLFAAFLLFCLTPVVQISCQNEVNAYTGWQMTAKDGPLRSNDDMSSLGNGEYRTENDRQAEGLRHEIRWFIFACAGIATLALLLLVPRWQGIVALLFGFGFRSWLSRIRETLESKFSDMSTMGIQVEAKFLGSTGILVAEAPLRQSPSEESFPWTARRFTPTSLA